MIFEHIEKLKQQYTDKYVVVDQARPELRRFRGLTGTVRTVNMSGKALVEFDGYDNIGWYDIDVDYLSIIDQPLAKPEPKVSPAKTAAKPAAQKGAVKPAAQKGAVKPAAPASAEKGTGKMSVEEMLAAARGEKSAGAGKDAPAKRAPTAKAATKPAKADPAKMSVAQMLEAARAEKSAGGKPAAQADKAGSGEAGASELDDKQKNVSAILEAARTKPVKPAAPPAGGKPKQVDPSKMSVQEMLAAARAEKGGAPAPAQADDQPQDEAASEQPSAQPSAEASQVSSSAGSKRNELTEIADILAYCRQVDGG